MTRIVAAVAVLTLAACTPTEVTEWYTAHGVTLDAGEAETIAEWINDRDCLPRYDSSLYVECAIADAAAAYGLDRAMLADLAWCESRHEPDARNPRSTATGLFQFLTGTWGWVGELGAPYTDLGRTHARANAFTAAWLIARPDLGGIDHWVCAP